MEFTHLATFVRSARGLLGETEVFELELSLLASPEAGDLIPGGRGLRKLRRPLAGHGKRGGMRIIYYYVASDARIYLVFAFAKSRQADLTKLQLKMLATFLAGQIP